jgi:type II secretory pathway component PulC
MPQPEPAASVLGGATVTQEDQEALSEHRTPTRLYADARVRPVYANEDLLGVKVLGIVPGSFWDQVGFREGDVVLEVNGELVDDPTASVHFMNSLSRQHELILRVRGEDGEERILEHRLPRNL